MQRQIQSRSLALATETLKSVAIRFLTFNQYVLDNGAPDKISAVKFSLTPINTSAPAPTTVKITLVSGQSATWFPCSLEGSTWNCPVNSAVTVLAANQLRVVAAQ